MRAHLFLAACLLSGLARAEEPGAPAESLPQARFGAARPFCFLDPRSTLFDNQLFFSPGCEQQRSADRLQRLGERSEWNQPGRHVLARVQPRIDAYLRARGLAPAEAKNLVIGTRSVRVQLPGEVCVFTETDTDCRPLSDFR